MKKGIFSFYLIQSLVFRPAIRGRDWTPPLALKGELGEEQIMGLYVSS